MINAKDILKKHNLSITENRIRIIEALDDDHHYHSIKEIKSHLKKINLKSLYNTLDNLVKENIISTISIDGIVKYGLNDKIIKGHHDIHVSKDGEIFHVHLNDNLYQKIIKNIEGNGYKIKDIRIIASAE